MSTSVMVDTDFQFSNQYLAWRHHKQQEMSTPICSYIAFNEWDAKSSPEDFNFQCSKVAFTVRNASSSIAS